jgi:predicted ribosomally synthesized six-cysteine peptide SCIFF
MKHIVTVATPNINKVCKESGCGECRSSCQSACKTSCTVGNQSCERKAIHNPEIKSR